MSAIRAYGAYIPCSRLPLALIHGRPATFGGSPNAKWGGGSNGVLDQGEGGHALLSIWRPGGKYTRIPPLLVMSRCFLTDRLRCQETAAWEQIVSGYATSGAISSVEIPSDLAASHGPALIEGMLGSGTATILASEAHSQAVYPNPPLTHP